MTPQENPKSSQLRALKTQLENLTESPLYLLRKSHGYKPVLGEGDVDAELMLVGEAPGENEAKSGRPFVGASGRFLNELLASINLKREDIYITNVINDRPPENRDPTQAEIALYAPLLLQQIDIIQPKVIVTLGRFAMDFILELFGASEFGGKISDLHGRTIRVKASYGELTLVPLYHPAVALYTTVRRDTLMQDFQVLVTLLPGASNNSSSLAQPTAHSPADELDFSRASDNEPQAEDDLQLSEFDEDDQLLDSNVEDNAADDAAIDELNVEGLRIESIDPFVGDDNSFSDYPEEVVSLEALDEEQQEASRLLELNEDGRIDTKHSDGSAYYAYEAQQQGLVYIPPDDPPVIPSDDPQGIEMAAGFGKSMEEFDDPREEAPPARLKERDSDLAQRVRESIRKNSETQHLTDVNVEVENRIIYLTGTVDTLEDIDLLYEVIEAAEGGVNVEDELEVRGLE